MGDSAFWTLLLPPGISPGTGLLLIGVSFFTSALTAAFGIGGGVAMLGALAGAAPPAMVIAVHGVVQIGSNFGRMVIQRAHILWRPVLIFSGGSVAGAIVGALVFVALPERALLGILGVFILVLTYAPKPHVPGLASAGLALGGFVATFVTMFVGATGPFVQALLLPIKPDRRALIATHATCMVIQHGLKVAAFGYLGFAFGEWLPLIGLMIAAGFLGTWSGTLLLDRIPQHVFETLLRIVLTIIGLDLLRRAIW